MTEHTNQPTTTHTADAIRAELLLDEAVRLLRGISKDLHSDTLDALRKHVQQAATDAGTFADGMRFITGDGVVERAIAR